MNYTLIRLVDETTDWAPVFALKAENGYIRVKHQGAKHYHEHWLRPQDVFTTMKTEDRYSRIMWEGSVY